MNYKKFSYIASLFGCFVTAGCATILTVSAPPVTEITFGEKAVGRQISQNYSYIEKDRHIILLRQPYCMETAKKNVKKRKRMHGFGAALLEMPLFGLGIIDLVTAGVYANASEEERSENYVETGEMIECGELKPAHRTSIYVQCARTGQINRVTTDAGGRVPVKALYKGFYGGSQLNLFVRENKGFAYITTVTHDRTF